MGQSQLVRWYLRSRKDFLFQLSSREPRNKATTNPPSLTPRSLQPHSQITAAFTPRPLVVYTETCGVCGVVVSTYLSVFQVDFVPQHYEWEVFWVTRASLDEKLISPAV